MASKDIEKFNGTSWTFPKKPIKAFKGAVQEYPTVDGGKLAVGFTDTYAVVLYSEEDKYFYTVEDYAARNGIFSDMDEVPFFNETDVLATVIRDADDTVIEDYVITDNEAILERYSKIFSDFEAVKADIIERLKIVGVFGNCTVKRML